MGIYPSPEGDIPHIMGNIVYGARVVQGNDKE